MTDDDTTARHTAATAGHTPGPWAIGTETRSGYDEWPSLGINIPCEEFPSETHYDAISVRTKTRAVRRANARLIAAAPDLLEACKRARYAICPDDNRDALEGWARELYDVTTEAIKKAKGEA